MMLDMTDSWKASPHDGVARGELPSGCMDLNSQRALSHEGGETS
jgi:hypothetical protein